MKIFSEDNALQLAESLLQNDKNIKEELERKIPNTAGFVTKEYVDNKVSGVDLSAYAKKDDLNGYAEVGHTHSEYLTQHQDLSAYALKSEIPTNYLSSIPSEYVTEGEMAEAIANAQLSGGDVDLTAYATKEYVDAAVKDVDVDLTGYAKTTDIPDVSNFVEKETGKGLFSGSYNDLTNKPVIPAAYDDSTLVEMIEEVEAAIDNKADKTELHTHINKDVLDGITKDKVASWDAKATEAFVTNAIAQAQLDGSDVDLSGLATVDQLDTKAEKDHNHDDKYALKTEIPSLNGLATEEYVVEKINEIELSVNNVDLSDYYTKTETDAAIDEKFAEFGFIEDSSTGAIDIVAGYRDEVVIPDKYNTGCKGELITAAEYFGDSYPDNGSLYITTAIQNTFGTVYENIHFDNTVTLNKPGLQSMTFRNCMFTAEGTYAVNTGNNFDSENATVTFENCEFFNQTAAAVQPKKNYKMINCKIHDIAQDGGKVFDNGSYENCYFYNLGYAEGAHADGIQVTGANNNFSIINCRFDMPYYDKFLPNAAIFFMIEDDSYNSTVKDCYMTGGNYTMYYGRKYPDAETPVALEGNTVENIIVGCSYQFGQLNDNSNSFDYNEVKDADKLFVSSVYKENGNTKLLVTNYTNTERTLRVVTNNGETSHTIPACPTYDEGLAYTSLSDFPFDIEYSLEEDADYIVCYDGDEQIRFVDFTGNGVSGSVTSKFDNYYTKEEVDNLIQDCAVGYTPIVEGSTLVLEETGGIGGNTTLYDNTQYRWQYVAGNIHPNSMYNYTTNAIEGAGTLYTCVHYIFNGEKKIRFSGTTSGGSARLAYAFVDKDGNAVKVPEFIKGELYTDTILDVPENAYEIYINGNNYVSPHLEVAVEDLRADMKTLPYLLSEFGRRLQYKDTFAWKPMDTGYIAFTFDDSLDDVADVVDLFISKGVPCCFGAIPEKLNTGLASGETVAQAMKRGVDAVGCEVLAHGSSATEIVVEDNIDDMDFLYNKFVVNKQKFFDFGFDVRGTVRVGGSGNICGDPRTDEWVRLFFDYGDLYGVEEPHNHARVSLSTGLDGYKAAIDEAITKKKFSPILFHQCPDYMGELIDYAISKGAVVCNYATAYDTFGSTEEMVSIDNRLKAIENIANGNEVDY